MHRASLAAFLAGAALCARATTARADDPPTAHTAGQFEAQAAAPDSTAPTVRDTRLRLQVGASLATGNTQSFAGNLAGRFLLRRGRHQFTFDGVVNYGRASVLAMDEPADGPRTDTTTAENYLARGRYDLFVTDNNGLFLAGQAFRDQPSGFNSRFSGQLGYLRNIINIPSRRRFWGEIGYDLTYENLTSPDAAMRTERVVHSGRVFLGFEEKASALLELNAGLEGLIGVPAEPNAPIDFRVNGTVGLASRITDDFSLAVTFAMHYLSNPVPHHEPLDTTTLVSVIFQRSLEPPPPPPPPPPPAPAPAQGGTP